MSKQATWGRLEKREVDRLNAGDLVWHMQRRERDQASQLVKEHIRDSFRSRVVRAPVHQPVTDRIGTRQHQPLQLHPKLHAELLKAKTHLRRCARISALALSIQRRAALRIVALDRTFREQNLTPITDLVEGEFEGGGAAIQA